MTGLDLLVRYADAPGWGLYPARAITITGDGTLAFTQPFYPNGHFGDNPLPQDMYDQMAVDTVTTRISSVKVRNLVNAFITTDFLTRDFSPPEQVLDTGWQQLTFRHGGRERSVDYNGAWQPPEFEKLRNRLLRLAREAGIKTE